MPERAAPPNQPPVGISAEWIDPINASLGDGSIGRYGHFILPALDGDTEDPQNLAAEMGLNNRDVVHLVPELVEVDPPVGNGVEDAANERLQQTEQEDLQALCNILGRTTSGNLITARHCWLVLKKLRDILREEDSPGIPHAQDYARILERLARVMTILTKQDYDSAHCHHPLGYEFQFKLLEEMTPEVSCPSDDGELLDRLRADMTATSSLIRVADGIYIIKEREPFARRLHTLAARVLSTGV